MYNIKICYGCYLKLYFSFYKKLFFIEFYKYIKGSAGQGKSDPIEDKDGINLYLRWILGATMEKWGVVDRNGISKIRSPPAPLSCLITFIY